MAKVARCPFGATFDPSVHAECPCPSCWADRSVTRLSTALRSQDGATEEPVIPFRTTSRLREDIPTKVGGQRLPPIGHPARLQHSTPETTQERLEIFRCLFAFDGRIDRASYWTVIAIDLVASIAIIRLTLLTWHVIHPSIGTALIIITILVCLTSFFSACGKRLHDCDQSAGWSLLMLLGLLWLAIGIPLIGAFRGTPAANRFGPPAPGWLRSITPNQDAAHQGAGKQPPPTPQNVAPRAPLPSDQVSAPIAGTMSPEPRLKLSSLLRDVPP
jgi:uncharacterized membrane protein YhaH (DUF805 family)